MTEGRGEGDSHACAELLRKMNEPSGSPAALEFALAERAATGVQSRIFLLRSAPSCGGLVVALRETQHDLAVDR